MKKETLKRAIWITIPLLWVATVFYLSEPQFKSESKNNLEPGDIVSCVNKYSGESNMFVVLQLSDGKFFAKSIKGGISLDKYIDKSIKDKNYRVIGRATIYHKVNMYVGFNIMIITQFIVGVLLGGFLFSFVLETL